MSDTVIRVENLSKYYRLGVIGGATLREDLSRWWARKRNRPNPFAKVGEDGTGAERGEIWALKDVSFEVREGEILGIIGRNGAGKSTLLKLLSRITEPTSGRAIIRGRVGSLLEVGTGFHPELTGRENIFLNGTILGMTKAEVARKLDEIVDFSEIEKFIDTPVKRYSSGMMVRLAFAVAAHLEPEILIIDEVLAVGDTAFQRKCLGKMGEVSREGRTVLFVSHNMVAVKSLCSRAILLDKGLLVAEGEVLTVVEEYISVDQEIKTECSWKNPEEAPGNHLVRIKSVNVINHDDPDNRSISVDTLIEVRIEIWNLVAGTRNISLHLKGAGGNIIFASPSAKLAFDVGVVRFECQIPKNLLNDGHYSLMVMVVGLGKPLYTLDDAVLFEVLDSERSGGWLGKWPGVMRPKLKWHQEQLCQEGNRGRNVRK